MALLFVATLVVPYWLVTRDGMVEISVLEADGRGDRVGIRVPAALVRVAAAFVPTIRPAIDDPEFLGGLAAAKAAMDSLADVPDALLVSVDEPGTRVRVSKVDGNLVIEVDDEGDHVRISIPPAAMRALADALPRLVAAPSGA
jgi:hypothetical protein